MTIGNDLKLLIKSINPSIIMDAALTVCESKWILADNPDKKSREQWIEDEAISLFRQLKDEVTT